MIPCMSVFRTSKSLAYGYFMKHFRDTALELGLFLVVVGIFFLKFIFTKIILLIFTDYNNNNLNTIQGPSGNRGLLGG